MSHIVLNCFSILSDPSVWNGNIVCVVFLLLVSLITSYRCQFVTSEDFFQTSKTRRWSFSRSQRQITKFNFVLVTWTTEYLKSEESRRAEEGFFHCKFCLSKLNYFLFLFQFAWLKSSRDCLSRRNLKLCSILNLNLKVDVFKNRCYMEIVVFLLART